MMILDTYNNTSRSIKRNARYEIYINILDAESSLKEFCRAKMIKVFPEMMQVRFVGFYDDMVEMIERFIAPNDTTKQRSLISMLDLSF